MTLKELWLITVYTGKTQIEDEKHDFKNPLLRVERFGEVVVNYETHNFTAIADREIKYFDFVGGLLRIVLKGE